MMEQLWWSRLVNSVRFLDDVQDCLMDERSVLLSFDTEIPWEDVMIETMEQRLSDMTDSRAFDVLDVSETKAPGEFLMRRYCSREERNKYWPTSHGSPEQFLAQNSKTPLNKRFVCLTGITAESVKSWTDSIAMYIDKCSSEQEHGIFILVARCEVPFCPGQLSLIKYTDYVSDYDCLMLCLTMISELSCSRAEKVYLCEAAGSISANNVEIAGLLASRKLDLIKDPYTVAAQVFSENGFDATNLKERVRAAVWEAQIKLVFPKLENFRAEIIRKNEAKLRNYLPIRSSNNDIIDKPADLEIGQLYYICRENKASRIIENDKYDMLSKMRDARNTLAHWDILSYDQLKELKII